MNVQHTGTFMHVVNMQQQWMPKQLIMQGFFANDARNIYVGHNALVKWMEEYQKGLLIYAWSGAFWKSLADGPWILVFMVWLGPIR